MAEPSPAEVFERARKMWPGFLPKQPSNAAARVHATLHHGTLTNADENSETVFVRLERINPVKPLDLMHLVDCSPMVRVVDLKRVLITNGHRQKTGVFTDTMESQLLNPWIVLALMDYLRSYRKNVYDAALALFRARVQAGKAEAGEKEPPLPQPITFVSNRTAAVLRGDVDGKHFSTFQFQA